MLYNASEPILGWEFIHNFLVKISDEVDDFQSEQPEYRALIESRANWNRMLPQLEASTVAQYDNEIFLAFLSYQETMENYLIVKALVDTIAHRICGADRPSEPSEIPGLETAESRLTETCRQFLRRLDQDSAWQCSQYLQARKAQIEAGHSLCWQCGVELAEGLLAQVKGLSETEQSIVQT